MRREKKMRIENNLYTEKIRNIRDINISYAHYQNFCFFDNTVPYFQLDAWPSTKLCCSYFFTAGFGCMTKFWLIRCETEVSCCNYQVMFLKAPALPFALACWVFLLCFEHIQQGIFRFSMCFPSIQMTVSKPFCFLISFSSSSRITFSDLP